MNVSFLMENGDLLPGGARRLNLATDDRLEIDMKVMYKALHMEHYESHRQTPTSP